MHNIEVSQEAVGHWVSSTARGTHRTDVLQVYQLAEAVVNAIIPSMMIHGLAEQLNGGLCSVFLHLRHVKVVHKDDSLFAHRRPIHTLAALVKLAVNYVLGHVCRGLCREVEHHRDPVGAIHLRKMGFDVHTFACARGSNQQQRLVVGHQGVDKEAVAHNVHGCDHDLRVLSIFVDLLQRHCLHPVPPGVVLDVINKVVNISTGREGILLHRRLDLPLWHPLRVHAKVTLEEASQALAKKHTPFFIHRPSHTPDQGHDQTIFNCRLGV
mmetsp:Transcript_27594/g.74625  ORF Transcript_27594/g.74625 Transcript_27594/m.74625 type:complete len:268 (+) Transcript_27594:6223-7026(+)